MSDESDEPDTDAGDAGSPAADPSPSDAGPDGSGDDVDAPPDPDEDDEPTGGLERVDDGPDHPPDARDADPAPDAPTPSDLIDEAKSADPMPSSAEPVGHGAGGGAVPSAPVEGDEEVGGILGGNEGQPPDDEEMPLADHIEEMVKRLAVVVIAVALATAVAFPFGTEVLNAMWYGLLPPDTPAPHLYGPLEKILSEIKVASLAGVLVALPVLVYEAYLFMRPGLYPRERRYFLSAVPTSLVLGAIGMAFAYFLVLPVLFDYFVIYSESGVDKLAFGLRVTFDLIVALLGAFALVFQIPMLIMLAIMMGVTTRRWLESRRIYFWGAFLGLGFLMGGADLTGMAPIIIAATMIALFEGTLALLRWTGSG